MRDFVGDVRIFEALERVPEVTAVGAARAQEVHRAVLNLAAFRAAHLYDHAARETLQDTPEAMAAGVVRDYPFSRCSNHHQVERRANPHCVGVDHFFDGICAWCGPATN